MPSAPRPLRAVWMGVTTILFDDGHDRILIDGFFTRPNAFSTFLGTISPDEEKVRQCLAEAEITKELRAVFVSHSHWDHVLDAPIVCKQTGAKLVGSRSTQMVGKGYGLPDDQMIVVGEGDVLEFGAIRVIIYEGIHSPGDIAPGDIAEPVVTPNKYTAFKAGTCYSFLVECGDCRVLVHPSANFVVNKFQGLKVQILFLGVATLGKQSLSFREEYWKELVEATQPSKIIPIHWDNFFRALTSHMEPLSWPLDKWRVTEPWLKRKCETRKIELLLPKVWEVVELAE